MEASRSASLIAQRLDGAGRSSPRRTAPMVSPSLDRAARKVVLSGSVFFCSSTFGFLVGELSNLLFIYIVKALEVGEEETGKALSDFQLQQFQIMPNVLKIRFSKLIAM